MKAKKTIAVLLWNRIVNPVAVQYDCHPIAATKTSYTGRLRNFYGYDRGQKYWIS